MADEIPPGRLPRVSVGRWKGDGPYPGGEPVFWQCNRCGHRGEGAKNDGEAYKDAAEHECPTPADPSG